MTISFDDIKKNFLTESRQRAGRTLTTSHQLPMDFEEITPAWLSAVLGNGVPDAAVVTFQLGAEDEGTSSRRHLYLTWNEVGTAAGLPTSVFCKSTMTLESRYLLGMNGGIAAEVSFYNNVRPHIEIRTPKVLFAQYDPVTLNSIVLMEDLAASVTFGSHELALTAEQCRSQLRLLARLHARYLESPDLATTLSDFNDWEDYFAITVEAAGFGPACHRGFVAAQGVVPARLFDRRDEIWAATTRCVDLHRALPRTLIHSDVHLKNWYIEADGEMGLNDWQCSCKGNWSRDLSYVLSTALAPANRRAWERDLVAYYVDQLVEAGAPAVLFDTAWLLYRQNLFSALAWWTGTLGQPPEAPKMQPEATSLEFIRRIATAIDDLDALDSFDAVVGGGI